MYRHPPGLEEADDLGAVNRLRRRSSEGLGRARGPRMKPQGTGWGTLPLQSVAGIWQGGSWAKQGCPRARKATAEIVLRTPGPHARPLPRREGGVYVPA